MNLSKDKLQKAISEVNRLKDIEKKAIALIVALNKSSTSLWLPCLDNTEECIVWNSSEYHESEDEDAELIELPGITEQYSQLCQALNISDKSLELLLKLNAV